MTGWWTARQRLQQRQRALAPAIHNLAVSKAGLDARLRQASPLLLTGAGFGLGMAAGRASHRRHRLPLPRLNSLLIANLDKALALLLALTIRGGGRLSNPPTPETTSEGDLP